MALVKQTQAAIFCQNCAESKSRRGFQKRSVSQTRSFLGRGPLSNIEEPNISITQQPLLTFSTLHHLPIEHLSSQAWDFRAGILASSTRLWFVRIEKCFASRSLFGVTVSLLMAEPSTHMDCSVHLLRRRAYLGKPWEALDWPRKSTLKWPCPSYGNFSPWILNDLLSSLRSE